MIFFVNFCEFSSRFFSRVHLMHWRLRRLMHYIYNPSRTNEQTTHPRLLFYYYFCRFVNSLIRHDHHAHYMSIVYTYKNEILKYSGGYRKFVVASFLSNNILLLLDFWYQNKLSIHNTMEIPRYRWDSEEASECIKNAEVIVYINNKYFVSACIIYVFTYVYVCIYACIHENKYLASSLFIRIIIKPMVLQPVVLTECPICYPAMENWNLDKLTRMLPSSFKCDVFTSFTHRFTYWDEAKNANGYNFHPPCAKKSMAYQEFYSYIRSSNVTSSSQTFPNLYLQQGRSAFI